MSTDPAASPVATTDPVVEPVRTGARAASRRGGRWAPGLVLAVLAGLPAVLGVLSLIPDWAEPYVPTTDQALFELTVRDVGRHQVLLGPYSRFGWNHPGPMAAYLLAVPYRLMGEAHQALTVGTLVIGGISSVAVVLLVRRRAGVLAGVWALLVLSVSVRMLGADFLRDSWNPYLPVLPLLAGVFLCWTAIRGDAWALPVAVLPMSLAVQSHVGFLPPVAAVGAVTAVGLLVRALRRRRGAPGPSGQPARRPTRWLVAGLASLVLAGVLWFPPIAQQVTGTPGNAGALLDYLREGPANPSVSTSDAVRAMADEFGKLPAYAAGSGASGWPLIPALWPMWAIAVGVALFLGALVVGVLRRRGDVLWLGALTLAVGAAGFASVTRVDGPSYPYVTQWTVVVGILAWTTVGLGLLPELATALRRPAGRISPGLRPDVVVGLPVAVLAVLATLVTAVGTARAETPHTDVTGQLVGLEEAVVTDLDRLGLRDEPDPPVVRVDFAGTTRPDYLGTLVPGAGLVLELARAGVDVQLPDLWRREFGARYTDHADDPAYAVTLAYADGSSPPPEPWQAVLAVEGELAVYGGVPPTGWFDAGP